MTARSLDEVVQETGIELVPSVSDDIENVLITGAEIESKLAELAERLDADYAGEEVLLVGILKGAFVLIADLARHLTLPVSVDFMAVSSYGSATKTSGVVRIIKDLEVDLTGRDVLLVEDIVDSGLTLAYLRRNLRARRPASLEVCSLLVKEGQQKTDPDLRYVGFTIEPRFVIGYGLDVEQRYRNLPFVAEYAGGPH